VLWETTALFDLGRFFGFNTALNKKEYLFLLYLPKLYFMKTKICLFVFIIALAFKSKASHLQGSFLSYKSIGPSQYEVTLELLRDCTGVTLTSSETIRYKSNSLGLDNTFTVDTFLAGSGSQLTSSLCPGVQNTCQGGILPGFEYFTYKGIVTLPVKAYDWEFSWTSCCRGPSILNIPQNSFTVYCTLNDTLADNNSVYFNNTWDAVCGVNVNNQISLGASEVDGDSISFKFIEPLDIYNGLTPTPYSYLPGFSLAQPFGVTGTATIDPNTGNLTFFNSQVGYYVLAIQTDEYRNGILISTSIKDLTITFLNNNNAPPQLSGLNGGTSYVYNYNVCPNSSFSFNINSTDANAGDSTFLKLLPHGTNATFTSSTSQNQSGVLNWTPTSADVKNTPYLFTFKAKDNACPQNGESFVTYLVYVTQCNTDTVWPGDANADFIADNNDIISLGIANGKTGASRVGANTSWSGQICANWSTNFVNNINQKHADCNGDGLVDITIDQAAVANNYGLIHSKDEKRGKKNRGNAELYFGTGKLIKGQMAEVPVFLGKSTKNIVDFYGIAANLTTDKPSYVDSIIFKSSSNNWINNSFSFNKKITNNKSAIALVKTNQQNQSGFGQIGTIFIYLNNTAVINTKMELFFTNTKCIDFTEKKLDIDEPSSFFDIEAPLSVYNSSLDQTNITPNPASNFVQISNTFGTNYSGKLLDITGKILKSFNEESNTIDVSDIAKGTYLIKLTDNEGKTSFKKIQILR
jgi:hypothetical protein